ncbi:hypothetical protein BpHYR1_035747 [Brachionus plicatilis]|uniref:Uncharacterized protein n=1 Tax=Brachionus plicatilis TaxID=10195 RepID=A0A3M7SSJ6_BRAPC|nr:hypothetical protein BpHYR1_035747 [Brachionus plicatilis]
MDLKKRSFYNLKFFDCVVDADDSMKFSSPYNSEDNKYQKDDGVNQESDSSESESEEEFSDSDCTINEKINSSEKSDTETKDQNNRILRKKNTILI